MSQKRQRTSEAKARTTFTNLKKTTKSDKTNQKKKWSWEHSTCALWRTSRKSRDASKTSTITAKDMIPATIMRQCEEIMARLKESVRQRTEAREQGKSSSSEQRAGGSGGPEVRDACMQTVASNATRA